MIARLVDSAFGGGSLSVDTTGVAADEWLVAFVDTDGGGGPPAPTGFTVRATASAAGADTAWIVVKDDVGPGNASYAFVIGGGADGAVHLVAVAPSGGGTIQFDDADGTGVASGTSTSMVAPSVDAVETTALLLNFWMMWSGQAAGSITPPGDMDELFANVRSNGWGHRSAYAEAVGSGATGTRTATASSTFGHGSLSVVFSEVGGGGEARAMAGTADSTSDATGVLASALSLAGTTDSASSAVGQLVTARDLAASTTSASDATGTLEVAAGLAGVTTSASDATGALELGTALAGTTDSISSASGELSIAGQVDLAAVSDSVVTASGSLTGPLALTGTADSASSGSGTLSVSGLVELEGGTLETDGGAGQLTVTAEVKRDTMVLPIAENLLACLCEAVAEAPNPPASCCLRPGVTVAQGVSEREDECCEGLAWVRVSRVFPTGDEAGFPNVNEQTSACNPASYGIELEMGVYRCAPTGDERNLPTCDEWTAATEQILDDAASMRRAWCCFRDNYANDAKLIGQWTPVEVQGGCTGGKMTIMIETYCVDCTADGS